MSQLPKGLRLNNPGNIERGEAWQGLAEKQLDNRFCTFVSAEWGIRALIKVLLSYHNKYGINNVKGIITRWAPPNENDTDSYIKNVCKAVLKGPTDPLDFSSRDVLTGLVKGITRQENGLQPYSDATIWKGIELAGVKNV